MIKLSTILSEIQIRSNDLFSILKKEFPDRVMGTSKRVVVLPKFGSKTYYSRGIEILTYKGRYELFNNQTRGFFHTSENIKELISDLKKFLQDNNINEIQIMSANTPQNWTYISTGDEYSNPGDILIDYDKVYNALKIRTKDAEKIEDYIEDIYNGSDPAGYQKLSLKELIEDFDSWNEPETNEY